jgi:hypothetical protein
MKASFYTVRSTGPEGETVDTLVARGDDLSFWMEPDYLELRPAEMAMIRRAEPWLIQKEPRSGRVLVNISKAIRLLAPQERQIELYYTVSEHLGIVADAHPNKWDLM